MLKGKKFDAFALFRDTEPPFRDTERPFQSTECTFRITERRFIYKRQNKFIMNRKQFV